MGTAKECKPVVTTVSNRDLYGSERLYRSNSSEQMECLSRLSFDVKNLLYMNAPRIYVDNESNLLYKIIGKLMRSRSETNLNTIKAIAGRYFSDNDNLLKLTKKHKKESKPNPNENHITHLFEQELALYEVKEYSINDIRTAFKSVVQEISQLEYSHINIFINNSNDIKFSLYFENDKVLMINKSFELVNEISDDNLVIYSLFSDDELIVSDVIEISTLINGFKKYLAA